MSEQSLDGEEHGHLIRKGANVVGRARDPGRAGDAAEAEDRHPLDPRRQTQPVHQARVDRRRGDARHRDEDEGVHIGSREAGPVERVPHGRLADLLRHADPGVVRLPPGGEPGVLLDGQRQVPAAHQDVLVQALQAVEVEVAVRPAVPERREQRLLVVIVRGESAPDGGDLQAQRLTVPTARKPSTAPANASG